MHGMWGSVGTSPPIEELESSPSPFENARVRVHQTRVRDSPSPDSSHYNTASHFEIFNS